MKTQSLIFLIQILLAALILAVLPACGKQLTPPEISIPDTTKPSVTAAVPVESVSPEPSPSPEPETITLTVYSNTRTEAPVNGWVAKTYTATGYCTEYQSKTYCWDDGMKTLEWTSNNNHYGPYRYSYFNLGVTANGIRSTNGGMIEDALTLPTVLNPSPDLGGTSETVSCRVEENGDATCSNFVLVK